MYTIYVEIKNPHFDMSLLIDIPTSCVFISNPFLSKYSSQKVKKVYCACENLHYEEILRITCIWKSDILLSS